MMTDQYVLFNLHNQSYGIDILSIKEVVSYRKITPLPLTSGRLVKGIINLRGAIVPVFDLRERFDAPPKTYGPFDVIVVMEVAGRVAGLLADEITDVVALGPDEIQAPTGLPEGIRAEHLKGIGRKREDMVVLLSVDRLLSVEESEILDAAS